MRILVGMSGGIDSTYAALKLKNEGHTVEGAVLIMHGYTELSAAKEAADAVGIPLHTVDVREAFNEKVIPNFISEYKNARTPNPCIICNAEVKFRYLLDFAVKNGFDMIATGHYADIIKEKNGGEVRYSVARATDATKDQSYMLYRLSQDILSSLLFPLGALKKEEIKENARMLGISAADRGESQEICFIPDGDYAAYIEERTEPSVEGDFVDEDGNVLGRHKGIINYTVGQRKGLGVAAGARIFVTDINPETNKITLSLDNPPTTELTVSGLIYSGAVPMTVGEIREYEVKLRYRANPVRATVTCTENDTVSVRLHTPAKAVTAGQSAVFYSGNSVAFGGFINRK